ncbi:hypothetical protein [Noviherbaspirillum aerium]|nr:hypothetical protein [Noviherbaspirillum aerium]
MTGSTVPRPSTTVAMLRKVYRSMIPIERCSMGIGHVIVDDVS